MALTATVIILEWVCPILGVILSNLICLAPLKELQDAVTNATGLRDLNPTPWAFMFANYFGWTLYGILTNNWFIYWCDAPGLLIACWLNLGAVKLIYENHHKRETQASLVMYLKNNDKKFSEEMNRLKVSVMKRSQIQPSLQMLCEDDSEDEDEDDGGDKEENDVEKQNGNLEAEESVEFYKEEPSTDSGLNLPDSRKVAFDDMNQSEIRKSDIKESESITMTSTIGRSESINPSDIFQRSNEPMEKVSTRRSYRPWLSAGTSRWSIKQMKTSFLRRKEKMNDWGEIVWKVTSQETPAETPHEKLLMGMIVMWVIILTALGFLGNYSPENSREWSIQVVGYVSNITLIFFYGAPLSRMGSVIKQKKCDEIHFPSLVVSFMNNGLWFAYGVAPQVNDPFLYTPCGLGVIFAIVQAALCVLYPRTKIEATDEDSKKPQRVSISSFLSETFSVLQSVRPSRNSLHRPSSFVLAPLDEGSRDSTNSWIASSGVNPLPTTTTKNNTTKPSMRNVAKPSMRNVTENLNNMSFFDNSYRF